MTTITLDGQVEFRFFRKHVQQVAIVADFTQWRDGAIQMQSQGDGWWTACLTIPPGEHHFRYLADEQWFTDFAASGLEPAKGYWNSVLIVPGGEEEEPITFAMPIAA